MISIDRIERIRADGVDYDVADGRLSVHVEPPPVEPPAEPPPIEPPPEPPPPEPPPPPPPPPAMTTVVVAAGQSIQAEINRASGPTRIVVGAGTYAGNLTLKNDVEIVGARAGSDWLTRIVPTDQGRETVTGFGVANVAVRHLDIKGSTRGGLNFAQASSDLSKPCRNVTIEANFIHDCGGDGIKLSQVRGAAVRGNRVDNVTGGQEGIDCVAVDDAVIEDNEVSNVRRVGLNGGMAIVVKGGGVNPRVTGNRVHHCDHAAFAVGQETGEQYMWREAVAGRYEVKGGLWAGNKVWQCLRHAFLVQGALDPVIDGNEVVDTPTNYFALVEVKDSQSTHNPDWPSRNVTVRNNRFPKAGWLVGQATVSGNNPAR